MYWEGTELGGVCSCTAIGIILAFAAVLIIQFFSTDNVIATSFTLPAFTPALAEVAELPFFALPSPLPALPRLTRGLLIEVGLTGSKCGTVAGEPEGFAYALTSGPDSTFIHAYQCQECKFTPLSALELELDGTCQSIAVRVSAVGAEGQVTSVGYLAQPGAGSSYLTALSVTVRPQIQILDDAVKNVHRQGLGFTEVPEVRTEAAAPPESVKLTVHLTALPYYSGDGACG